MSTTITYKGSTIATVSNATKTLKTSGKYLEDDITVVESTAAGSATTPTTTITANPSISVSSGGLITATATASKSITPTVNEGYVTSGTAGTVTVSGSNTQQLSTQTGITIQPEECSDLWDGLLSTADTTHNNASFVYDNGVWTVTTSAAVSGDGAAKVLINAQNLPSEIEAGNHYYVTYSTTSEDVRLRIVFRDASGSMINPWLYFSENAPIVIPSNASKWSVILYIVSGVSLSSAVTVSNIHIYPTQIAVAKEKYTTGNVYVVGPSSTYVGSDIDQNDSTDLIVSGATVTAPAGYYASSASKSVASMALPTTTDSSAASGYSLKKTVVRSTQDQYINIPTGYNSAGAYYKVNAVPDMTLPTSAAASATSGFTSKATISRSTSDQYINIPTGYNSAGAYYKVSAVANGTAGTPIAIEGAISNHQITITPSVVNTEGYISGGTKTGAVITVKASDLVSGTKSITSSGTEDVTNYAEVSVPDLVLPTSAAASSNGGTKKATIGRSTSAQYINLPSGFNNSNAYYEISAVANGSVTAPSSISATGATVTAGTNTLTLSKTVSNTPNVTTAGYISSGTAGNSSVSLTASVNTRSSSDLTASGATVTAPAGYYAEAATKSIASGSATTPQTTIEPSMNISIDADGLITALTQKVVSVTPTVSAGYISSGTAGNIIVDGSKTKQLTTQEKMVAEADASGDILAGLTTQYYYTIRAKDLVQGLWNLNVPQDTPTTRARTQNFVYVTAGSTITYVNNTYDCFFQVYQSTTSGTYAQSSIGWQTASSGTINITANGYLTFVVRNHYNTNATVNPALWDGSVVITYAGSHNGVNWTWEGSNTCVVSGTCNSSNGAVSNLIANTAIPSSIVSGDTYYVTFNSSPAQSNARFRIIFYDSNGDTLTPTYYFTESGYFVVPTGATNWTVGLHSKNVTYSSSVTLTGMNIYATKKIIDAGTYVTGDIYVCAY